MVITMWSSCARNASISVGSTARSFPVEAFSGFERGGRAMDPVGPQDPELDPARGVDGHAHPR